MPKLSIDRQLSERQELIHVVGNRLFLLLLVALVLGMAWTLFVVFKNPEDAGSLPVVLFVGVVGGLIGLQNRLVTLADPDLILLSKSTTYLLLAPLVGGFLAVIVYVLFISGLLQGDLFPSFRPDIANGNSAQGIARIFDIDGRGPDDYAKLIFWCFLAGFSERFVTNIMTRFEGSATTIIPAHTAKPGD